MLPADRLAYSPISERAPLKLPDRARMVVWVILNIEEWDPTQPMPRTVLPPPAGGSPSPDVPNWSWHEYGNRVGFWRFTKIFDEFAIPVVLAINGSALAAWLGPGLTETWETPDLLAEDGYDYVADWVLDDQPVWLKTRGKPILNLPYTQEINEVAMITVQNSTSLFLRMTSNTRRRYFTR